jgi:DNA-binding IclR family transcriptional regulator
MNNRHPQARVCVGTGLERRTPKTITDLRVLVAELAQIREIRYAIRRRGE